MPGSDAFVLDWHYADWVYRYIESRGRVYWPDDERLTFITDLGLETNKWYRDGTWDKPGAGRWQEETGIGVPDFTGSAKFDFVREKVRSTRLAGVAYTVIGSWYTFEATNDANEPMVFDPIRLPVTQDMIPEAKEWARERGGSHQRTKGVEFQERFATALEGDAAQRAARQLSDVHLRIPDLDTEQEAKDTFREATDMAERAVRQVM